LIELYAKNLLIFFLYNVAILENKIVKDAVTTKIGCQMKYKLKNTVYSNFVKRQNIANLGIVAKNIITRRGAPS